MDRVLNDAFVKNLALWLREFEDTPDGAKETLLALSDAMLKASEEYGQLSAISIARELRELAETIVERA